jgi:hypothetical protein
MIFSYSIIEAIIRIICAKVLLKKKFNHSRLIKFNFIIISIAILCLCNNASAQESLSLKDITVLAKPAHKMMRKYLTAIVDRQFAARDSLLSTFKTAKDWAHWAQTVRDSMASWTGPFPKRTSLHARITGKIEHKDYVIKKIIFDSRPNFPISADLYLPKNVVFPRPAILDIAGHWMTGKSTREVQLRSIDHVKKGFVVLAVDWMIGQGERNLPA